MPDPSGRRRLLAAAAALLVVAGCDRFNPAAISRERHPEFYGGAAADVEAAPRPPARAAVEPAPEAEPAPDLSELPGETVIVAAGDFVSDGSSFDIAAARGAGALAIDVNDPAFAPRLDALFDGDTTTLARTEDVNPLVLRMRFETPVHLRAVRIFPSYSTYDWALRPHPDQPRLLIQNAAEEQWSAIELPEAVETTEVRLELRRLVRDNYVHLNEVELLVED